MFLHILRFAFVCEKVVQNKNCKILKNMDFGHLLESQNLCCHKDFEIYLLLKKLQKNTN